ncbi:DUF6069 family protein [Actinomadura sp. NTSP31]|uniref:DUF6069 family protein n=1 Tax=Actinomadura sp. NTSP31 TaxID=1735447 RepID=UPI0035C0F82F
MAGPVYRGGLPPTERDENTPAINMGRLWGGGIATAVVAALFAAAGVLIMRGVLDIPIMAPKSQGTFGDSTTAAYMVMAGVGGILATLLLHLLILMAPAPLSFYSWIAGLATLMITVLPFAAGTTLSVKVATALINFVVGMVYVALLPQVAAASLRSAPARPEVRGPR